LTAADDQVIANIAAVQVSYLQNEVLCKLPEKAAYLEKVEDNRLHHLTIKQIKARNLSTRSSVVGHVFTGIFKTLFSPLLLVVGLVIRVVQLPFYLLRMAFAPRNVHARKCVGHLKMTFVVGPAINLIAPLQIFNPAKYLQLSAKWRASCEVQEVI